MLVSVEGGNPENTEKNPRRVGENQQQTLLTYGTWLESNPGHISGETEVSNVRH